MSQTPIFFTATTIYPALQQPVDGWQAPIRSFDSWYQPWSLPVRIKPGLRAERQQYLAWLPPIFGDSPLRGWYNWYSEPVRRKPGLWAQYQQFLAYHPRILPTPDVTVVIDATEINNDVALFGVVVYDSPGPTPGNAGAAVTIIELPAQDDAGISIREP